MNSEFDYSVTRPVESKKLVEIFTDYENIPKFFPPLVKSKILERNQKEAIFEQTVLIPAYKLKIVQKSIHREIDSNRFEIEIISGPLRKTITSIIFTTVDNGTKINISLNLRLSSIYKIFRGIIKKKYMRVLESLMINIVDAALLTPEKSWKESIVDDGNAIVLSVKNLPHWTIYGWWYSELKNMFADELYSSFPVNGKTVIDIGANIADSSIYFISKGAKKVVALEPFPFNFEMGKKNIEINQLSDKIDYVLAGASDKSGEIFIDAKVEKGYTSFRLVEHKDGFKIPTMTLKDIIDKYHIESAVLKLDCEGCEYKTILTSGSDVLQKFSDILIEYHNGYKELKEKLETEGFTVSVLNPSELQGYMTAKRIVPNEK